MKIILRRFARKIKRIFYQAQGPRDQRSVFAVDPKTGLKTRHYSSYAEYLAHQQEKLGKIIDKLRPGDLEYEEVVYLRYAPYQENWAGKRVICLGARLGGEVRAFKRLGALAIGIDIEPGPENRHVLFGDFHEIQFPDGCFDVAFTNALDHVLNLNRFLEETVRLLAPGGTLFVELPEVNPSQYEVLDTSNISAIIQRVEERFQVVAKESLVNHTSYASWGGVLLRLKPKSC